MATLADTSAVCHSQCGSVPMATRGTMTALVTVGSTKFDLLVEHAASSACLDALQERGISKLIIQYGNSRWDPPEDSQISITAYKFKKSLAEDIQQADLVISHAG